MKIDHVLLLACLFLVSGCGLFPAGHHYQNKRERNLHSITQTSGRCAVQRAEIIYFPVEAIGDESIDEPPVKIVQALKNGGTQIFNRVAGNRAR